MTDVYITKSSAYLPNDPISNNDIELYLGKINGKNSKSKAIVLRNNGIEQRYYALDKSGKSTHTNAEMTALAIRSLFDNPNEIKSIELLSCGTTSPDQLLPSHGVMVHGLLPETENIEVVTHSGACCAGMHSLKHAFLSVKANEKKKIVCCGSERMSPLITADKFQDEIKFLSSIEQNPYIAFEKDFLRWMLSDGAGAFLIENKKNENGISLKIEWIELCSFANKLETCMYMGAEKLENGSLISYLSMTAEEIIQKSTLTIKQDVKLLSNNIVELGFQMLSNILKNKKINIDEIDYFIPHMSSYFFENKIYSVLKENNNEIPYDKWFTNLKCKGNVGAGSIYIMVEELFNSNKLQKNQKILLAVPESARFSYAFCLLTVC